jgi:predicted nucleotidyltransferase
MAKIPANITKTVTDYLRDIERICHVDKAILFGSYVNGSVKKHSDIDIAIFSKQITEENRLKIMARLIASGGKFKKDIQPMAFPWEDYLSGENDFIVNEIIKKGIEIEEHS